MSMKLEEIVANYKAQKINPKTEGIQWPKLYPERFWGQDDRALYCDGKVLYSYTHRNPIACLIQEAGEGVEPLFFKNGDIPRGRCATHQSEMQKQCEGLTVSFGALREAKVDPLSITPEHIVEYHKPISDSVWRDKDGKYWLGDAAQGDNRRAWDPVIGADGKGILQTRHQYRDEKGAWRCDYSEKVAFVVPAVGMFVRNPGYDIPGYQYGYWHILGACLLHIDGRTLLCSLDEQMYFVSELPEPVDTITAAFERLKPDAVRQAEARGATVLRQGEWFCIDTGKTDQEMQKEFSFFVTGYPTEMDLPRTSDKSNRHKIYGKEFGGHIYASRFMRHRGASAEHDGPSGEHKPLKLGPTWWEVHRNTEIGSWRAEGTAGRID